MCPSGNTSQAAQAVFDHLYAGYLGQIPVYRTEILWSGPIFIAIFSAAITVTVFLIVFGLRPIRNTPTKLHELTSFAGQLTERGARLTLFSATISVLIVIWAAYFAATQIAGCV